MITTLSLKILPVVFGLTTLNHLKILKNLGFSDFRHLFTGHIKPFSHDLRFFVTAFGANAVFVERDSAERATA